MASSPGRTCGWPGCPRLATGRDPLCEPHRIAREKRERTARERGYDWAWEKLRAVVLREEPFCRFCLRRGLQVPSETVDHIRPKSKGGTDHRFNLRALCARCHHRRSARDAAGWTRR